MSGTLYVSAAGAQARMTQLDIISDNLANASTTGFRASEAIFEAELEAALLDQGDSPPNGRTFVGSTQAAIREGAGPVRSTGRDLDVAIQAEGFFVVETEAGPRYTRAGSFLVDPEGQLVSASGTDRSTSMPRAAFATTSGRSWRVCGSRPSTTRRRSSRRVRAC